MTLDLFAEKVKLAVRAYFGDELQLTVQKVMKNNGVELTGLVFADENSDVASTVYLNGFYKEYEEGETLGAVVRRIVRLYEENRTEKRLDMDFFRDYEKVKGRLACRLIHRERNAGLLEKTPYREFLNLAVVPCCLLIGDELGCACVLVSHSHLRSWGIPEEQLMQDAMENMPHVLPPELASMDDFMREIVGRMLEEQTGDTVQPGMQEGDYEQLLEGISGLIDDWGEQTGNMYILTNTEHFYGAAAILYPGLLARLADEAGCNLVILPSSVHEVILLADSGDREYRELYRMVEEVNAESVPREEILSDDVYYYRRDTGEVSVL